MSTDLDHSSDTAGSVFGRGLVHRSRSQTVLARRRPAARLIGAVGRSSIGFGLAVGRSRSIRPVVRRTDLNSATLRPPPGFWLDRSDDDVAPDELRRPMSPSRDAAASATRPSGSRSTPAATAPRATPQRRAPRSTAQRRIARIETSPIADAPTAATWTDQVIQRSGVGYVRPTSQTFTPAPARDDDFVPSNDAKLDDLRLLVAARQAAGGAEARSARPTPAPDPSVIRRSTTTGGASTPVVGSGASARGDTAAGRSTGPGRLARSVVPESAVEGQALTSTKAAGGRARASAASATTAVPATPGRASSPRQRARRSTPQQRMDDLRDALLSKGLLPTSDGDGGSDEDHGDVGRGGGASPTGRVSGGDGSPAPTASATGPAAARTSTTAAPTVRRAPRSDREVSADDPRTGGSARTTPDLVSDVPSTGRTGGHAASTVSTAVGRGHDGGDAPRTTRSSAPTGLLQRRTTDAGATAGAEGRPAADTARSDATDGGRSAVTAASDAPSSSRPDGLARSADLDVVRPAAGVGLLDADDRVDGDPSGALPGAAPITVARRIATPEPSLRRSSARPDAFPETRVSTRAEASAGDTATGAGRPTDHGPTVDSVGRRPPERTQPTVGLPVLGGAEGELRRRLSLPRAMSSTHRPAGALVVASSEAGSRIVRRTGAGPDRGGLRSAASSASRAASSSPAPAPWTSDDGSPPFTGAHTRSVAGIARQSSSGSAPIVRRWLDAPVAAAPLPSLDAVTTLDIASWGARSGPTSTERAPRGAVVDGEVRPDAASMRAGRTSASPGRPLATPVAESATPPSAQMRRSHDTAASRRPVRSRPPSTVAAGPGALIEALRRTGSEPAPSLTTSASRDNDGVDMVPGTSTTTAASGGVANRRDTDAVVRRSTSESPSLRSSDRLSRDGVVGRSSSESPSARVADGRRGDAVVGRSTSETPSARSSDRPSAETVRRSTTGEPGSEARNRSSVGEPRRGSTTERAPSTTPGASGSDPLAAVAPPEAAVRTGPAARRRQADSDEHSTGDVSVPGIARSDVAEVAPLAERFMSELATTIRRRPAPLPVAFQPMAEAIAGERRSRNIMVSTDTASRRALRRAGKVAATTDNVIHLAQAPTPGERLNEIIAHELTHVANPSPVARFFDDVDDSPEERQAERVAKVMASSPIAPTASTLAPSGRPAPSDVVRRTPAPGATRTTSRSATLSTSSSGSSSGAVSAAALAASISSTSESSVQRLAMGSHRAPASAPASSADSGGETAPWKEALPSTASMGAQLRMSGEARDWFVEQLEKNFDWLLHAIEDRMIVEMERRGGRLWEGL